ncbi:Uncharacterized protein family Cys-rich [Cynara cardunculus var. scolymus]|uniref:Uncharacterized protein family Cys-rich n=1 Tax=Cynara cardunculus var. scolymus TaxID=59895 RepID=A0A103YAA8_CYNCS|nr:Uncharacterized protein family Cys-rich [Cynara cardunculus var. scolymus]
MEKAPQPTTGAQSQPQPQPAPPSNPPPAEATPNGAQPAPPAVMVVGVPPQQVPPPAWSTGLFECFDDPTTLIITFFAPCVTFGQVAEMVDQGRTSVGMFAALHFLIMYFTGCGCLLSAYFRIKMSHLYRLPDDPIINILVHLICEPCALCQEYRELQHRGFNMKLVIITFFAPCVTFGQIAEMVDRGRTSVGMYAGLYFLIMYFTGCGCLLSAYFRIKMSHIYRLPDDPLINILVHLICEPCALCQEYRELQHHGFNMQLGVGWHNQTLEVQQIGAPMEPPMPAMSSPNKNVYQTLLGSPPSSPDDQLEPNTTVLWSSGCLTCWCPCITFGRIAEGVDHGKTSCVASAGIHALLTYMTGFGWMYSYIYRSKMRKQYTGDKGDEQQKYGVEAVPVTPGGMIR